MSHQRVSNLSADTFDKEESALRHLLAKIQSHGKNPIQFHGLDARFVGHVRHRGVPKMM